MKRMLFYLMIAFALCGVMILAPQMATQSYAAREGGSISWTYHLKNGYTVSFKGTITGFNRNGQPYGTGTLTVTDPNGNVVNTFTNVPYGTDGFDATGDPALANFLEQNPDVNQAFIAWLASTY